MPVRAVPGSLVPAADQGQAGSDTMSDGFCIDEDARVAYVTTHRQNTTGRIKLDGSCGQSRVIVAGDPLGEQLPGPRRAERGDMLPAGTEDGLLVTSVVSRHPWHHGRCGPPDCSVATW